MALFPVILEISTISGSLKLARSRIEIQKKNQCKLKHTYRIIAKQITKIPDLEAYWDILGNPKNGPQPMVRTIY
jgi:hypothetical protein